MERMWRDPLLKMWECNAKVFTETEEEEERERKEKTAICIFPKYWEKKKLIKEFIGGKFFHKVIFFSIFEIIFLFFSSHG